MTATVLRRTILAVIAMFFVTFSSSCWDNHEIDTLFMVTGVALDQAAEPGQTDLTFEIGRARAQSQDSQSKGQGGRAMYLGTTATTAKDAVMALNRDSSRTLWLYHNQAIILGSSLAENGVADQIDFFMRDQEARLEVLLLVADGRAEDVLRSQFDQEGISGVFLARLMNDLSRQSKNYRTRLLDFASRLLDPTTGSVVPIIKIIEMEGEFEAKIDGLAVFKDDKMVGRLTNDQTTGYIWGLGDVQDCSLDARGELGEAAFHIIHLNTRRVVTIRDDGGVRVDLSVDATLNINELKGFMEMPPDVVSSDLMSMAQEEIKRIIVASFEAAKDMGVDIFGIGASVHQKHPKEWKGMVGSWDEIFPDTEIDVQVKVRIPMTGQIIQSLKMRGFKGGN